VSQVETCFTIHPNLENKFYSSTKYLKQGYLVVKLLGHTFSKNLVAPRKEAFASTFESDLLSTFQERFDLP